MNATTLTLKTTDDLVIELTTGHAASCYGQPVAVLNGIAYGPGDLDPGDGSLPWLRQTMAHTVLAAAVRCGARDQALVQRFCSAEALHRRA